MIDVAELRKMARARLTDAKALFNAHRYDAASYLVGYSVEIALKARICKLLKWKGFPETRGEFEGLETFKTHKLGLLLLLSGRKDMIDQKASAEWSAVATWDPETRYRPVGSSTKERAEFMIASAGVILAVL
jgi:HEPN domain